MVPRARRGFTLIEIMIVVAIVTILTALGIGMSSDLIPRYRTRKAAMHFAAMANQCRSVAIRTSRECSIWLFEGDSDMTDMASNTGEYWVAVGDAYSGSTDWSDVLPVNLDTESNDVSQGTIDLGDSDGDWYARHVAIDYTSGTLYSGHATNEDRIVFNPRGFVSNPVGDFDNGYITITFVNKSFRAKAAETGSGATEDYTVSIARSGMVRVDTSVSNTFSGLSAGTTESSSP